MKNKRIVNRNLVEYVKTLPSVASGGLGGDCHHVSSRGSGGDDVPENLMPLSRKEHIEWHQLGPKRFCEKYPMALEWLKRAGRSDVLARMKKCG